MNLEAPGWKTALTTPGVEAFSRQKESFIPMTGNKSNMLADQSVEIFFPNKT